MSIVGFTSDRRNDAAFKVVERYSDKVRITIRKTWFSLGRDLKNEAQRAILKPKKGRTYTIRIAGGRTRRHTASAPGETHANLSGDLRKSVSWKVHGAHRMDFGYGFSTTDSNRAPAYDAAIEFGREDGLFAARPSIGNAIKKLKNNTNTHFEREMLKEFRVIT